MTDFVPQVSNVKEDRRRSGERASQLMEHSVQVFPKQGKLESTATQDSHIHPQQMLSPTRSKPYRPEQKEPFFSQGTQQKPVGQRPPWVGTGSGTSPMNGAEIMAPLGRMNRYHNNRQQKHDTHFLQTLRVADDPNTQWRNDKMQAKLAMEQDQDDDELPDVFMRLTDPSRYPASHSQRFRDGYGMGLEGRRDDISHMVNVAGDAKILRDDDPEMDSPHKPIMPWDEDKLRTDAYYSTDMDITFKSNDAYDDATMTQGVHGRLSSVAAIPPHKTRLSDYEREMKMKKSFNVHKDDVFQWQAHSDEIGGAR